MPSVQYDHTPYSASIKHPVEAESFAGSGDNLMGALS